jgi:hypothetical protein
MKDKKLRIWQTQYGICDQTQAPAFAMRKNRDKCHCLEDSDEQYASVNKPQLFRIRNGRNWLCDPDMDWESGSRSKKAKGKSEEIYFN